MKFIQSLSTMVVLYYFMAGSCFANLLMISKEHGPQLSTDLAQSWTPVKIPFHAHIDFFDAAYDQEQDSLYIAGYHKKEKCFVVFQAQNNEILYYAFIKTQERPLDLSKGDHVDFMKIRVSSNLINVFGRLYYACRSTSDTYKNFYLTKKREMPYVHSFESNDWFNEKKRIAAASDSFTPESTILDIITSKISHNSTEHVDIDTLYFVNDPYMMGTYPFYKSAEGQPYIVTTGKGSFSPTLISRCNLSDDHSIANLCNRYPLLYKDSARNVIAFFGDGYGETFVKSLNLKTENSVTISQLYQSFGTAYLAQEVSMDSPQQLFFLVEKANPQNSYTPTAVLASTHASMTSTCEEFNPEITQRLDQSILSGLTKEQIVKALENNAFSRFVREGEHYLFFLSYGHNRGNEPFSFVLRSADGQRWSPQNPHTTLPKTVREVITLPPHFKLPLL